MVLRWLFRVNASRDIGTGHLMRCIALAEGVLQRGYEVLFVLGGEPERFGSVLTQRGIPWRESVVLCMQEEETQQFHVVVIDGYEFPTQLYERTRASSAILVSFDDGERLALPADIVINQNYGAESLQYSHASVALCGSAYVLLRREFLRLTKPSISPRARQKLLLSFGGSDPAGMLPRVLPHLYQFSGQVRVVVGFATHRETNWRETAAQRLGERLIFYEQVSDMSGLLQDTDLAICAAGSVLWELSYFGVPTLACTVAENQRATAKALLEKHLIFYAGEASLCTGEELAQSIAHFLSTEHHEMAANFLQLVDGRGVERVIASVERMIDKS